MVAKNDAKTKGSGKDSAKIAEKEATEGKRNLFYKIRKTKKELIPVKARKRIAKKWGGKKLALKNKYTVKRKLRKSIQVGKVAIILTGKHMGKRCIIVKILDSGLLVVMNPFEKVEVPLTKVDPAFLIVTSTNIFQWENIKKLEEELKKKTDVIQDSSFVTSRQLRKDVKKLMKEIGGNPSLYMNNFEKKYEQLKQENPQVKALMDINQQIKKMLHPEIAKDKVFSSYLKNKFTMRSDMSLHRMKF